MPGPREPASSLFCGPDQTPGSSGDAVEVGAVGDASTPAGAAPMARHLDAGMGDPHRLGGDQHPDPFSDQPPGNGVGVGIELDRAVGSDAPAQLARRQERAAIGERLQPGGLVAHEAHHRRLAGRAMHALVGDLPRPARQMGLEGGEALEAAAGDGVALHVADAALVLALGSRPIGRTGPNLEAPVPREGMELGVQHHLDLPAVRFAYCGLRRSPGGVRLPPHDVDAAANLHGR